MKVPATLRLLFLLLISGNLFYARDVRAAAQCPQTLTFDQWFSFGSSSPIWSSDFQTPFVAYFFLARYASFDKRITNVYEGPCASTNFQDMVHVTASKGSSSVSSISTKGGVPDFRFRSRANLSRGDAEEIVDNMGCGGAFRFRDVFTFNTTQTNRLLVKIRIRMDGNTSLARGIPGGVEQPARRDLSINVQDLTFCSGIIPDLVNIFDQSTEQGPDFDSTYELSVCPTAILRLDIKVDLAAPVLRFFTLGETTYFGGGVCYADYSMCQEGNSVCFEDCAEDMQNNCSSFSVRVSVVENPAGAAKKGDSSQRLPSVQIVSAAGFDYAAPALPEFKPSLRVSKVVGQDEALVEWPAAAPGWAIANSGDFTGWNTITNVPALNVEEMMRQIAWPLTNGLQFFRLQKP